MQDNFPNLLSYLSLHIIEHQSDYSQEKPLGTVRCSIGLVIEGSGNFKSSTCDFTIHAGDMVFIPNGCVYSSRWFSDKKIRFYALAFHFTDPGQNTQFLLQPITDQPELAREIRHMYDAMHDPHEAVSIFYRLYAKFSRVLKPDSRKNPYPSVFPAVQYLQTHCRENITVAQLAKLCKMSESYFFAVFRQETGYSPIRYKNKIKCTNAVELLLSGNDTLDVICDKLNISNPAFLRRLLLQETGKTPRQIRKDPYGL